MKLTKLEPSAPAKTRPIQDGQRDLGPEGGILQRMDPHRLAELRSLAYHRVIVERLHSDPRVLADARARVRGWIEEGRAPHYAGRWQQLLSRPQEELCAVLVDDGDDARALRQATPFAGVLAPRERWRIWEEERRRAERR
ncbi:MAG: hypothetical protein ACRENE_12965 [Polyangiaceae bacterium]